MITWIQNTFGRHHKYILAVFLVIVAISMIFIGSVPSGPVSRSDLDQPFLGVNLNDQRQMEALQNATWLTLNLDIPPGMRPPNITTETMNLRLQLRIALLHLADQWQIPKPTLPQIEEYVRTVPAFQNPYTGQFEPSAYNTFKDQQAAAPRAEQEFTMETLAQNWRIERVRALVSGPGYSLPYPAEVEAALRASSWNLEVALFDLTTFKPQTAATDAALEAIYQRDPTRFQLPPQLNLTYVKFPATPVAGDPTLEQLREFLGRNPDRFPGLEPDKLGDQAEAVKTAWRLDQGVPAAGLRAGAFVTELDALNRTPDTPEFAALLKKYELTPQPLPPLPAGRPAPADLPVPAPLLEQAATQLNAQAFFTNVLRTPDGAVVLFFNGLAPSRLPAFAEVRADVLEVFNEEQKARELDAKGKELQQALTAALAAGKTFTEAATALGLKVKNFPDASMLNPPMDLGQQLLAALFGGSGDSLPYLFELKPGTVSPLLQASQEGALVYVQSANIGSVGSNPLLVQDLQKRQGQAEQMDNQQAILRKMIEEATAALQPKDASGQPAPPSAPQAGG